MQHVGRSGPLVQRDCAMKYLRYALVLGVAALLAVAFTAPAWAKNSQPLVKVPYSKKAPKKVIALSEPLDLNLATKAELEAVNGIGPVLAERIVKYRRKYGLFTHKDQLVKIKGIGPESYDLLRDQVKVGRRKKIKSR